VRISAWSGSTLRLHEFDPVEIEFQIALPRLGANYVGLGIADLEQYFDAERRDPMPGNPDPPIIYLEPVPQFQHLCHQH